MDYKNRDYFVIGRNLDYTFDHGIIKRIKRYFNCKIKCKWILINGYLYFYCIGVNKRDSDKLINYLKDNDIKYIKVFNEPIVLNRYSVVFIDENRLFRCMPYWYKRFKDKDKEKLNKIINIEDFVTSWKTPAMKLLDELTKQNN